VARQGEPGSPRPRRQPPLGAIVGTYHDPVAFVGLGLRGPEHRRNLLLHIEGLFLGTLLPNGTPSGRRRGHWREHRCVRVTYPLPRACCGRAIRGRSRDVKGFGIGVPKVSSVPGGRRGGAGAASGVDCGPRGSATAYFAGNARGLTYGDHGGRHPVPPPRCRCAAGGDGRGPFPGAAEKCGLRGVGLRVAVRGLLGSSGGSAGESPCRRDRKAHFSGTGKFPDGRPRGIGEDEGAADARLIGSVAVPRAPEAKDGGAGPSPGHGGPWPTSNSRRPRCVGGRPRADGGKVLSIPTS